MGGERVDLVERTPAPEVGARPVAHAHLVDRHVDRAGAVSRPAREALPRRMRHPADLDRERPSGDAGGVEVEARTGPPRGRSTVRAVIRSSSGAVSGPGRAACPSVQWRSTTARQAAWLSGPALARHPAGMGRRAGQRETWPSSFDSAWNGSSAASNGLLTARPHPPVSRLDDLLPWSGHAATARSGGQRMSGFQLHVSHVSLVTISCARINDEWRRGL